MIGDANECTELEGPRWKAVLLGLRLGSSYHLGVGAIGCSYTLWCLIGFILGVVFIPFALLGKMDAFVDALNPGVVLYGFLLPMALIAATTWAVKLFSRLLWCAVPERAMATFLAFVSAAGRLAVLSAIVYLWLWGGPFGKGLLLPETVVCSGIAWFGLAAEWGFIRTLRREFIAMPFEEPKIVMEETAKPKDSDEWLRRRYPRAYVFVWECFPWMGVTAMPPSDSGLVEGLLFSLDAVFDEVVPLAV